MQHHRSPQLLGNLHRTVPVHFKDLHPYRTVRLLQLPRNIQTDITSTGDQNTPRALFFVAEDLERAHHLIRLADHVGIILDKQLVIAARHEQSIPATGRNHHRRQVRKQLAQLLERRVDNRAVLITAYTDEHRLIIRERNGFERSRLAQPPHDHFAHFDLR